MVEWGVFDKKTDELLSVTTFESFADAMDELVEIHHASYAYVDTWPRPAEKTGHVRADRNKQDR